MKTRGKVIKKKRSFLEVVDLFCGCGAVSLGLKLRGFKIIAAIDNNPIACETYRKNHSSVTLYEKDIKKINPEEIRKKLLKRRDIDLLVVCSPCQPFSSLNQKSRGDARQSLIYQACRFAKILRPKVIFFENVPGLTAFSKILDKLNSDLKAIGYVLSKPTKLDAADFGVPQRRFRCIMIAKKIQKIKRAQKISFLLQPVTPKGKRFTVKKAIGDLACLKSGESDESDKLHFARKHQPIVLRRLSYISKDGGTRFDLPKNLELKCHRNHKGHPDVYGRMRWNSVAPTLTTGCTDITKGRFGHPRDDRAITLREAARLQTFPDNYKFIGNAQDIATQIGNAVPVKLVEEIAAKLKTEIFK